MRSGRRTEGNVRWGVEISKSDANIVYSSAEETVIEEEQNQGKDQGDGSTAQEPDCL